MRLLIPPDKESHFCNQIKTNIFLYKFYKKFIKTFVKIYLYFFHIHPFIST